MSFYQHTSYKSLIKEEIQNRKETFGQQYSFQGAAKAAGIQKTYLSKVFADSKTHLSEDQFFKILNYMNLSEDEQEFAEKLHRYERAQDQNRKNILKIQIENYREQKLKTHSYIESKSVEARSQESLTKYYSNPNLQILHMLLTIPTLAINQEPIPSILGISKDELHQMLKDLVELEIVELGGKSKGLKIKQTTLHLKDNSVIFEAYRKLMRLKSIEKIKNKNDYSFSVVFSCDSKTRNEIHEVLLNSIKKIENLVKKSKPDEVHQINIDLLKWFGSLK